MKWNFFWATFFFIEKFLLLQIRWNIRDARGDYSYLRYFFKFFKISDFEKFIFHSRASRYHYTRIVAENNSCLFPVCTYTRTRGSFCRRVRQWGRRHYGNISLRRVFLPPSPTNRFSIAKVSSTAIRPRERGALKLRRSPLMNIHLWQPN